MVYGVEGLDAFFGPDQPPKAPVGLASTVTVRHDLRGKAILAPAIHLFKEGFHVFKAGLAVEVLLAFFRGQEAVIYLPYWSSHSDIPDS